MSPDEHSQGHSKNSDYAACKEVELYNFRMQLVQGDAYQDTIRGTPSCETKGAFEDPDGEEIAKR